MKTFVKLMPIVIIAAFLATLLGCAPAPAAATQPPASATQPPAAATQPPASNTPVTLTYSNWNLGTEADNNIQRQMIKAYTTLHPNVTIKIVDIDTSKTPWDAGLTALAAKGALPDVFMANNVPLYVQNDWLADVSALIANDADYKNVPQPLKDAFIYSSKTLALPAGQFIMGYFVNMDLYDAANLTAPEYGVSVDDFFKAAQSLTNIPKGVLGLDEQFPIEGWYPSTQDSMLKYYSFDGTQMNYNSAAFKAAVAKTGEMIPYTWQGLSEDQQKSFKSKGPWELFTNGEVGVRWDASWTIPDLVKNATFNWDFVGIPGGNQCIVFDAMVISKTAPDVQAAYDFAKWMTFSSELI